MENKLSSLLSKSTQEVFSEKFSQSTLVAKVTGYSLDPQGSREQQILHVINARTKEPMDVVMRAATTERAATKRVTILDLKHTAKFKTEVGGFVRLDNVKKEGDLHTVAFVRRLKGSENDHSRTMIQCQVRAFPPASKTKIEYGENVQKHFARMDIIDQRWEPKKLGTGADLIRAINEEVSKSLTGKLARIGTPTVFIREHAFAKVVSIAIPKVNENNQYRIPRADEILRIIEGNDIVKKIAHNLDQHNGPEVSLEFAPGRTDFVSGQYAGSEEYERVSGLFNGNMQLMNNQTGELEAQDNVTGFRDAIVGYTILENGRLCVASVSPSFTDPLTLNGMVENRAAAKQQPTPTPISTPTPTSTPAHYQDHANNNESNFDIDTQISSSDPALQEALNGYDQMHSPENSDNAGPSQ